MNLADINHFQVETQNKHKLKKILLFILNQIKFFAQIQF